MFEINYEINVVTHLKIYIYTFNSHYNTFFFKFNLYSKLIGIIRNSLDQANLQMDLRSLYDWTVRWRMSFNLSKCKVMHLGRESIHQNRHYYFDIQMFVSDISFILDNTLNERDLGIIINNKLNWQDHINQITMKANVILGRLKKTFVNWKPSIFRILYKAYIRPLLEYASSTWYAIKKSQIKQIEKVQRRATKCVPQLRDMTYDERLKALGLTTLQDRRIRGDLILYYKIQSGFNKVNWFHPNEISPASRIEGPAGSIRGASNIYKQTASNCESRRNFFANRVIDHWNKLPEQVKNAINVNEFKIKYDRDFCSVNRLTVLNV